MIRILIAVAILSMFVGCATTSTEIAAGRGLYWSYDDVRLEREGYPGYIDDYSTTGWGILYDDEGVSYGPKSFYSGRDRLDHPRLEVTEEYIQSAWVRIEQSECCTEPLLGHYLEILDLAWKDLTDRLRFVPEERLQVYSAGDMPEFFRVGRVPFFVTHRVEGPAILLQPADVLFRRTLAGHVAYAAVGQALLDMKTSGRIPHWVREGLSSYLAQEGYEHLSFMGEFRANRGVLLTPAEVERDIYPLREREVGRIARYNAFLMVWYLSERYGFTRIIDTLDHVAEGQRFDQAVELVYGVQLDVLLTAISPAVLGEPTTTMPARGGH